MSETRERSPVLYEQSVDIRFADLDAYGHVTSSKYLELVFASRFLFVKRTFGLSATDIVNKGIGFFLVNSQVDYRKGITEVPQVFVRSFVSEFKGPQITVKFEILSADQKVTHSTGTLLFLNIDMKTNRPVPPPDWVIDLFMKP